MLKFAAICSTYKRPDLLAEVIECFRQQDYPADRRELIVLDDAGQYCNHEGDGYRVLSLPRRFRTVGEKRNATAALASPDADAYCVWDDDDIYLPWHISAAAMALAQADYTIPSVVFKGGEAAVIRQANTDLYHGAWSYRRTAFEQAGGYPFIQSGQDQGLLARFRQQQLVCSDPLKYDPRPSYLYRWHTAHRHHLSVLGPGGFEQLGSLEAPFVGRVTPSWSVDWAALVLERTQDSTLGTQSPLPSQPG